MLPAQVLQIFQDPKLVRYVVFQLEKGDNGTEHYQGYVEFHVSVRFAAVVRMIPGAHWEPRRGTRDQARDYCMKDESRVAGPYEHGEFSKGSQGHRSDLDDVVDTMSRSHSLGAVIRAHPTAAIRYAKGISLTHRYLKPRGTRIPPVVNLLYGPTGTGKTRFVMSMPNVFKKSGVDMWFDGYDGEPILLIDDFAGAKSRMPLSFVLQLLDRYACLLPVKGSFTDNVAVQIFVTTNLHPKTWYDYPRRGEHYRALARRFHKVYWFTMETKLQLDPKSFWEDWFETCDETLVFQELQGATRPTTPADEPLVIELSD